MKLLIITPIWLNVSLILLILSFGLLLYPVQKSSLSQTDSIVLAKSLDSQNQRGDVIGKNPQKDIRISVLQKFFKSYNSPLENEADFIVKTSDTWGLDYKIIPAISMQESGGCKNIPDQSFNCWGFGIYGKNSLSFTSYSEAISQVAKTIKQSYFKDGLTNMTLLEDRWNPSSTGQWSFGVNFFISKIKEIEVNISAP